MGDHPKSFPAIPRMNFQAVAKWPPLNCVIGFAFIPAGIFLILVPKQIAL